MSDLRPIGSKVIIGYKTNAEGVKMPIEYGIRFTVAAVDEIQDHFDIPIGKLGDVLNGEQRDVFDNLCFILMVLINEEIECVNEDTGATTPKVELKYIAKRFEIALMAPAIQQVFSAIRLGSPKNEDDAEENPQTGQ